MVSVPTGTGGCPPSGSLRGGVVADAGAAGQLLAAHELTGQDVVRRDLVARIARENRVAVRHPVELLAYAYGLTTLDDGP